MAIAGIALLLLILGAAAVLAFEVWMFVDAVQNRRLTSEERILWCLGMLFIHPFVAIAYYFIGRHKLEG